jgi:hypothetical protein
MSLVWIIVILVVIGIIKSCNWDWLGQILAGLFFYWVGTWFASISEVLSWNVTIETLIAGFCYLVALWIIGGRIYCWLR